MGVPDGKMMRSLFLAIMLIITASTAHAQVTYYDSVGYVVYPEARPSWVIVVIKITPRTGWKWNDEYPHKFIVEKYPKMLDKYFEKGAKSCKVSFLLPRPKKMTKATIVGKFSICSSIVCVVLRDQRFQYKILSTKPTKKNQ